MLSFAAVLYYCLSVLLPSSLVIENALRNVSMFFRSEPTWNVVGSEPLKDIGWRIRKQYYLISNKDPKLSRHLLTWVSTFFVREKGGNVW